MVRPGLPVSGYRRRRQQPRRTRSGLSSLSCQAEAAKVPALPGCPVPCPVKLADPGGHFHGCRGRPRACGNTATAPSAPSLGELVRMNFSYCEQRRKKKKSKTLRRKKKKKWGREGGKRLVRKRAIKTDRAANERKKRKKKKKPGAEGLGCATFAQSGAGCFKGRRCPKEPEHYAGSAGVPQPRCRR